MGPDFKALAAKLMCQPDDRQVGGDHAQGGATQHRPELILELNRQGNGGELGLVADFAKGKIVGSPPGFAKLLVEKGSDRILGFHMIGPQAADLLHEVVVAMNTPGAKAQRVRDSIHVHPTLAELVKQVFDATA